MALFTDRFTIADLEALPDDGFHRELLDGVLLVNPLAGSPHQLVAMRCLVSLTNYLQASGLGVALAPGRVLKEDHTALEPDVLVLPGPESVAAREWADQPTPLLVVEIVSRSSRRFDYLLKRDAYLGMGVAEYWILDPRDHSVLVVKPGQPDERVARSLRWQPAGAVAPLTIDVPALFASLP